MHRLLLLCQVAGFLAAQQIPPPLSKATSTFLSAVATDDAVKLASVSRFPIKSNEFKTVRSIAELQNLFPAIFTKERKAGLAGQNPVLRSKGIYSISSKNQNDPIEFLFKKYGKEYKFFLIDNINE